MSTDDDNVHSSDSVSEGGSSESDPLFDARKEGDQGEQEDIEHDKYIEKIGMHDLLADEAPPIPENEEVVPPTFQSIVPVPLPPKSYKVQKKKGRGPAKGVQAKEPMHLEYDIDSYGQPCGKWRAKYGTHIGLCVRKLYLLDKWQDVEVGLKKAMWNDTVNLFHIQPDAEKKNVFLSAVAERFRNFKTKLVSRWITCKRKRGNRGDDENKPKRMPWDVYPRITETE